MKNMIVVFPKIPGDVPHFPDHCCYPPSPKFLAADKFIIPLLYICPSEYWGSLKKGLPASPQSDEPQSLESPLGMLLGLGLGVPATMPRYCHILC